MTDQAGRAGGGERIAVIGLGYVGLPLGIALARWFDDVIGFDIDRERIAELKAGRDWTQEVAEADVAATAMTFTDDPAALAGATMFVVTVPTPINREKRPNFEPLLSASRTIAPHLRPGAVVVYESTVYPGATEEVCGPELERAGGKRRGVDFKLAYSPERINPGDKIHTLENIVKVVSGEDEETLDRVAALYGAVIRAGVHRAPSIRVAEAAKVIENTQRDLNIALMNELALIFDRLGLRTQDVLEAATTKWNFLPFKPGLVGGHCIGVDPYYLTSKAEMVGYHPQVILSGRRINDEMGLFVARRAIRMLVMTEANVAKARVGVLGLTFKENVPDLRNSKVVDVIHELRSFGVSPIVHDPQAEPEEAHALYDVEIVDLSAFRKLDALILAVNHRAYLDMPRERLFGMIRKGGVLLDVKSALSPSEIRSDLTYWSL